MYLILKKHKGLFINVQFQQPYFLSADFDKTNTLFETKFPEEYKKCSMAVRHKNFHIDPKLLLEAGIKVTRVVQQPGDFVITFPRSYHTGYNSGANVAEAANFACPLWMDCAGSLKKCECEVRCDFNVVDVDPFLTFVYFVYFEKASITQWFQYLI